MLHRCHYFNPDDDPKLYKCSCGDCDAGPTNRLLQTLDQVRHVAQVPFVVTSGPRCPDYNAQIGSRSVVHVNGDAADIQALDSRTRYRIVMAAIEEGVHRIGIGEDFVHLDVSESSDPDVIWTYYG